MEIIALYREYRKVPHLFITDGSEHLRMLDLYQVLDDDFTASGRVSRKVIMHMGGEVMEFSSVEELQDWVRILIKL